MLEIPNKASAAYVRQAGVMAADIRAMMLASAGDGIISGLSVAQQGTPDMTVAVAAGVCRIGGYYAYVNAQNATITTAHATLYRCDLVVCDWNGVISVVAGTAAAIGSYIAPDIPANSISLAQITVPPAVTSIITSYIYDKGPTVYDFYDLSAECLNSSLSGTVATSAGSITEAGFTMSAGGTPVLSFTSTTANHPGVLRVQTGTTSANSTRLHFGNAANTQVLRPAQIARLRYIFNIPTITTMTAKFGAGVDLSVATAGEFGTAGAFIEFVQATSAKWRYVTRQASTSTTNTDTGADVTAGSWYDLVINRLQNGNIQFVKNGAIQFTHTANLPTTNVNVGLAVHTLTAAARNVDIDFFGFNQAPIGNRWT